MWYSRLIGDRHGDGQHVFLFCSSIFSISCRMRGCLAAVGGRAAFVGGLARGSARLGALVQDLGLP